MSSVKERVCAEEGVPAETMDELQLAANEDADAPEIGKEASEALCDAGVQDGSRLVAVRVCLRFDSCE